VAQAYEKFSAAFSELGRIGQGGNKGPSQAAVISILLIEDSDHDLGVAQAFFDRRDRIFSLWADFLRSCSAKSTSPEDTGYDFGSGQVSKVFDFDGALKVVEALRDSKI
jgi:1,2-phenylacetyl-CoA epoxidase PaaB subunit